MDEANNFFTVSRQIKTNVENLFNLHILIDIFNNLCRDRFTVDLYYPKFVELFLIKGGWIFNNSSLTHQFIHRPNVS
jgi:hypothetical protein